MTICASVWATGVERRRQNARYDKQNARHDRLHRQLAAPLPVLNVSQTACAPQKLVVHAVSVIAGQLHDSAMPVLRGTRFAMIFFAQKTANYRIPAFMHGYATGPEFRLPDAAYRRQGACDNGLIYIT